MTCRRAARYRRVDVFEAAAVIRLGTFDLLGSRVNLRASAPLAKPLQEVLADLSCRSARRAPMLTVERFTDGDWSVAWRHEQRYSGPDASVAFYDVFGAFNEVAARQVANVGGVGLHGGAVAIDGRALALVGHSGSGKSTLTAALVCAGHGFVADEVSAVSGPDAQNPIVSTFHRPIGLRRGGAAALGIEIPSGPFDQTFPLRAESVGELSGPAPLEAIAFVERDEFGEPTVEPISPAVALHRLSDQTLGTWGLERETFRRLETMVKNVRAVVLRYAETADGVALAEQLMSAT